MRPSLWQRSVEFSIQEEQIVQRIRRAKLFVFLRHHRHALFIEATLMDRRWQLVLDCLETDEPPFSKGTFVAFRKRLIDAQMDRRLIGGEPVTDVGHEAEAGLICGPSLKAALDRDWDQVEAWVQTLEPEERELAQPAVATATLVKEQDVQRDENGKAGLIKGVAKDRRVSIEDAEMRHGRKSRSVRIHGYKRHVLHDLDTGLIRAVGFTPANAPEASVTEAVSTDLEQQAVHLKELHIDRAYLSSHLVRQRSDELAVYCKAWPVREGKYFHKHMFTLDWEQQIIRCPAAQEMSFVPGSIVHFPEEVCAHCPLQAQCTTSSKGRSVSIHPDEALLLELRKRQQTPEGRTKLRERTAVEHTLAHVGRWQGRRARYRGLRKNLFDLRRCAVVHNLHVMARSRLLQAELQDTA